jgi:hypothetical protein
MFMILVILYRAEANIMGQQQEAVLALFSPRAILCVKVAELQFQADDVFILY